MPFGGRRHASILVSAVFLAVTACATHSPAPADPPPAAPEPELRLGEVVERELLPGETHAFALPLEAGRYLRAQVRPRAMDVALRLLGPDGASIAEADGPGGSKERERLSVVTTASGRHRLLVIRRSDGDPRVYKLELQELRAAVPKDATRVQAERAFGEGLHRLALGTKEDLALALARFEESLSLWRAIGDQAGQVDCLNHFGAVAYYRGETKEAIVQYQQALLLAESAGYQRGLGEALNNLGLAHARIGDREATPRFYRRALEVWQGLADGSETARTWHNLGWFYLERGETAPALDSLSHALELRHAAGDVAGEASTLNALGTLNQMLLGDTRAALEHFSRALPLSRAAGNVRLEAYLLGNLPNVYRQRGDLQRALELYRQASEKLEALGDTVTLANVLEGLGGLYVDLGDFEKAARQYRRVLVIYRAGGNRDFEARALSSLGLSLFRQGESQEALAAYGEAQQLSREIGNRWAEIAALRRRAVTQRALGDAKAALADLEACLALEKATGNQRERAAVLLELGSVARDLGDPGAAAARFEEALGLARRTEHLAMQSEVLLRWAELERDRGGLEPAKRMLEEALAIVESVRQRVVGQELRGTYSASLRSYYDLYIDVLMRSDKLHPGKRHAETAFQASERSRARGLAELLAEGRIDVRQGIAEEFKEREIRIGIQISKLQTSLLEETSRETRDESKVAELERRLEEVLEKRERLEEELRTRHPRYAEVRYPEPLVVADLQAALGAGTAFLEYALGAKTSYLFVVTQAGFYSFRLPPADELQREIERFRQALVRPEHRLHGQLRSSAYALYTVLLAPAADLLGPHHKWIIAPDGLLHLLPFEALLTAPPDHALPLQDQPYVVKGHAIGYVPSAGVLRGLRVNVEAGANQAADASSFVAFADPIYGGSGSEERSAAAEGGPALPGLPETRREAETIAGLYPRERVALYLGSEASEENAKARALSSARRIHFAVHGHLDEARPELSGLFLSRNARSTEDGILQAYEIFNLEFGADLVVLSACETGLGKPLAGEGLVGLSRAFFYAGVPSLVTSLWRVADVSTADMMIEFYRRLNEGRDRGEALRAAKLRLMAAGPAHPFYWAPFILVGDS
ncbi:MAG TPA: CHAT domain-containing protein [Thermoanaerobaculia bacterium]|nr:CHAT domain-containing protein [Thermoanaerobaculia bacterium]